MKAMIRIIFGRGEPAAAIAKLAQHNKTESKRAMPGLNHPPLQLATPIRWDLH